MKRSGWIFSLMLLGTLVFPASTFAFIPAICDLCTIGVVAGLGVSRALGIDDSVVGVWIGAVLVTLTTLTLAWFQKKNWYFKGIEALTAITYYGFMFLSLYLAGIVGAYKNTFFSLPTILLDKILVSSLIGSMVFIALVKWYEVMKANNGGHAYFPFQKVIMPIGGLALTSTLFYFLTAFHYV